MDKDITRAVLARTAQDRIIPQEEWAERARRALADAEAYRAMEEAKKVRMMRPTAIYPGGTFNTVPVKQRPNNWLYNTLSDPRLNAGLETLAGNAADVLLGRESGNNVVDLGVSNIPGIGAASILAAGGMPGIVDVAGAGELRNLKKIPKYTYEFVSKHFGDMGLKNLDNALTKYPKAEKPSVNDALYILKTGLGGETVPAKAVYSSNVSEDLAPIMGYDSGENMMNRLMSRYNEIMSGDREDSKEWAKIAYNRIQNTVERGDSKGALTALTAFYDVYRNFYDPDGPVPKNLVKERIKHINKDVIGFGKMLSSDNQMGSRLSDTQRERMRLMKELTESPTQDWESIVAKQEKKNARNAKETPVVETPSEPTWDPNVMGDSFYRQFGGNLTPESKRDMFVLDSLANHWARQIIGEGKAGKLTDADIVDALDRAEARHTRSNYNAVSKGFYDDVKKNIASGNMPGKAVTFGPKYRKNVITDRDTPTLILDPSEKPRFYNDVRIWADEQEGPDLYEMVFRPKSDEILNSINPAYWLYRK